MSGERKFPTLEERVTCLKLFESGKSSRVIASELCVGRTQVQSVLKHKREIMWLGYNMLGNIPRSAFSGLTQLKELSLSGNGLESIDAGDFEGLPNITKLHLRDNRIRNISRAAFGDLTHLKEIHLKKNPLVCDCQLRWLIETFQAGKSNVRVYDAVCSEPAHLKGRYIRNVTQADINCSTHDINECTHAPCKNDATCTNLYYTYTCTCSSGWQGNDCDEDINECAPVPCKNGATCNNLQNAYSCTCSPGWYGNNCDHEVSTSQAPGSQSTSTSTTESLPFVYSGIGLCVGVLAVTVAVIIFIKHRRRRRHNIPSYPMADPTLMTQCNPSPIDAHRDEHEYEDVEDVTETCLQSNVHPVHGATSTDDDYLIPMTAKPSRDISLPLKTKD
ncbi:hypothetical protein DPMN_156021 [Dreissena polymorpha]|uniref:EGF-like domain-containing protein n=1 Tax=Dreissena polymorpha TaxID=45954 RepID=A0A9D4FP10_DREPO|nr:hypothetical protein DPMN_156021 [Dreissena polymorpha]